MATAIKGEGMLWVTSRVAKSAQDILDEPTFLKWYDEDHIAEIVETRGINNAFRYIDVDKGTPAVPKPYLAFYPMPDLAFTQGEEFKHIKVKSDILPGSGIVYDLADIDVSYFGLVGKTQAKAKKETPPYILVSAIEPADGASDEEVNKFYDDQTTTLSETPGYLRTLRFRLLYARTNAQSRKLKGLPTTDEPAPEPPTWQAVHEFSTEPDSRVRISASSVPSEVLKQAKQNELHVYKLAKVHGKGKFFE
ncbi:hypothetical protein BDV96DRAFT_649995 [Lophiotrema nucula]|uniref:Uncharacterized protein n=1 Tax=Lophiotrema nucula TaxID=690887 RepID=A0A6A5YWD9_9PLEO|nr:hypothetical protein BDV96DRAFT_649995 [Lophiotrema nucula]